MGPSHLGRTVMSWEWLHQVGVEPYTPTPKYDQWITIQYTSDNNTLHIMYKYYNS